MAVYKKGDNNEFIKEIQKVLGVDPIGNFGPKTEDAVKAFQKKHGLTADGIVGESTLVKLGLKAPAAPAAAKPAAKPAAAAPATWWNGLCQTCGHGPERCKTACLARKPNCGNHPPTRSTLALAWPGVIQTKH